MATSSLLGIDSDNLPPSHSATGIDSLGPSDASDSGSDSAGAYSSESDSDTDRFGTGERSSVEPDEQASARDILPDHIENTGPDDTADPDGGMLDDESGDPERIDAPLRADDLPGGNDTDDAVEADEEDESGAS